MKKPIVDIPSLTQGVYLANKQYLGKFIRNWGTITIIDPNTRTPVEVLKERNYIFRPMEKQAVKFLKYSKGYGSVARQGWKGIEQAWMFINPSKDQVLSDDIVAANLEKAAINAPDAFEFQVAIELYPQGSIKRYARPTAMRPTAMRFAATTAFALHGSVDRYHKELKAELVARRVEIWNNHLVKTKYSDPYVDTLARYSIFEDSIRISTVGVGIDTMTYTESGGEYSPDYTYNVSIPVLYITFTNAVDNYEVGSPFVVAILTDVNSGTSSDYTDEMGNMHTSTSYSSVNAEVTNSKVRAGAALGSGPSAYGFLGLWQYQGASPNNPEIWVKSGGRWYLRKDFMMSGRLPNGAYIPMKARIEMLSEKGFIDTGWRERSCDFWCSVTKIVIIVIAVIISVIVPGVGTAVGMALITAVAMAVVLFSLIIAAAGAIAAGTGDPVLAREMAGISKTIAPIVMIAGVVLIVTTGIDLYNSIGNTLSVTAQELAMDTGEQALASSLASSNAGYTMSTFSTATSAGASVAERLIDKAITSAVANTTNLTVDTAVKYLGQLTNMYTSNELSSKGRELANKTNKLQQQESAIEDMRRSDAGTAIISTYASPLQNEWARSYSIFESYCEGTRTNVQATHVGALMGMGTNTYFRQSIVGQTMDV